jgi:hypothetical protein
MLVSEQHCPVPYRFCHLICHYFVWFIRYEGATARNSAQRLAVTLTNAQTESRRPADFPGSSCCLPKIQAGLSSA